MESSFPGMGCARLETNRANVTDERRLESFQEIRETRISNFRVHSRLSCIDAAAGRWVCLPFLIVLRSETDFLERQWLARRVAEEFPRLPRRREAPHSLPAGNQGRSERRRAALARRLHHVLEHREEEGLRWHCHLHEDPPTECDERHRHRRARQRRSRAHRRVPGLRPGERLCPQLTARTLAAPLPPAVGPRFPPLPQE